MLLDAWVISIQYLPGGLLLPEVVLVKQGLDLRAVGELRFCLGTEVSVEGVHVRRLFYWKEELLSVFEVISCFYNYSHLCSVWVTWIDDLGERELAHNPWLLTAMDSG